MKPVPICCRVAAVGVLCSTYATLCPSTTLAQAPVAAAKPHSSESSSAARAVVETSAAGTSVATADGDRAAKPEPPTPSDAPTAESPSVTGSPQPVSREPASIPAVAQGKPGQASGAAQAVPVPRRRKTRFPFRVQIELMPVWQLSNGFDFFSDGDISKRIGLGAGYDLFELSRKTPLSVELGWSAESLREDALFPGFQAAFRAQNLYTGLSVRHHVWPYVAPYAALHFGASAMTVEFSDSGRSGEREYKTNQWTTFGSLGAGLAAMLPIEGVLMLGVSAEGGYLVSGSMPLRLDPQPEVQRLATKGVSLGTLGRSGPYLRFAIFCRF